METKNRFKQPVSNFIKKPDWYNSKPEVENTQIIPSRSYSRYYRPIIQKVPITNK